MIVRILGEGQFEIPDTALAELNEADEALVVAIATGDQEGFDRDLARLYEGVHRVGTAVPADHLGPSDLVLPAADATLEEVRALLGDDGLIPG